MVTPVQERNNNAADEIIRALEAQLKVHQMNKLIAELETEKFLKQMSK